MTCKRALRLLQLSRPGEISPRERRKLDEHVLRCSACATERKKILKSDIRIAEAREFVPRPEDARELTAFIMEAVRGSAKEPARRDRVPAGTRTLFSARPGLPVFAGVLAVGVAILPALMAVQTWTVLKKVSALEAAMAVRGGPVLVSRAAAAPMTLTIEARGGRERLVIDKAALGNLLQLARRLSAEDFARLERILDLVSFTPWGASVRSLSEEDRMFLIKKTNDLRTVLRSRAKENNHAIQ